ncbi:MAG: hypothetical protein HYZ29_36890 [Myxococcales bacterium]|nr:hypothetical protein [Myxococcales bacterium]
MTPRSVACLVAVSCSPAAAPSAEVAPPATAAPSVAPTPAPTPEAAPAPPAIDAGSDAAEPGPTPEAAADPEAASAPVVRASFALRAGVAPCQFVFRAGVGSTLDIGRYLMAISRIELLATDVCAAHVVYDAEVERKAALAEALDALQGGFLPNPGKLGAAAALGEGPPPLFVDANFDGYLDLAVEAMSGAYNSSSRYWLFEPSTKRFVRSTELEVLLMPRFFAKRKRIAAGGRAGGNVYVSSEHEWVKGKLETVWSQTTYLGETPQGQPLPRGFREYRVRYERRGTTQKKVFDGPARR